MNDFIKTGVIGHPISHSKSPLIHNHWISKYELNGSYEAIDIKPENLNDELPRLLHQSGYSGFNLTIPHKEIALDICDEIDNLGKSIGAVNTIKLRASDNKIIGTNTDAYGFIHNIKQTLTGFNFCAGPAVILGAGGAAKAIIYGLLQENVPHIIITNRTRAKADKLAQIDKRITVIDWNKRHEALDGVHLLVNTSALGMAGKPALEIDLSLLPVEAAVSDIVYAPLMTNLLDNAQKHGNSVVTGIGMLLHQARPAFELWYGVLPDVDQALESIVL